MKGGKDKKKVLVVKPEFAPPREPLEKPKNTPDQEFVELRKAYQEKAGEYFPGDLRNKISQIFHLFARTYEDLVTYEELKEILVATNNVYPDEELLKGIYNIFTSGATSNTQPEGVSLENVFVILTKRYKDNDKKKDMMDAFEYINSDEPPPEVEEEKNMIKSAKLYDALLYHGYKYSDEQADAVLKEADPKNKGIFGYDKFVDNTLKTDKKKKKKSTKKKK